MPITLAFTITSALALVVHGFYLRRMALNRRAVRDSGGNGDLRRISIALLNMEGTRFALNTCFLLAGLGILFHQREAAWLLAAPPVLSILASTFGLRGIR